jgi:DHA1 family bicyclomycin/chloramphenicol resistance-like MFS transporter
MNRAQRTGLSMLLASLAMFGPFSIDTLFPAFPVVERELGVSALTMQQTLSVYLLAYAFMSLFHGALSDSFGRRRVILLSVAAFTLASVGCALAASIEQLLAFRALQGITAGAGLIVGRAIIRDLFEGAAAQKLMSNISLLFGIGPALAPVVGGWVLLAGSWRWIFWFLTAWAGVMLAFCLWRLPETHPPERRVAFSPGGLLASYGHMLGDRQFWPLAIASTVNFSAIFLYISSAPAVVMGILKLGPQQFPWLFIPVVSGMVTGAMLSGRVAGRLSAERTVAIGYVVMLSATAVNLGVTVLLPPQVPWSLLPLTLYAIGMSMSFPTITLLLLDRFPRYRGGASSAQAFVSLVFNAAVAGTISVHLADDLRKLAGGAALLTLTGFAAWWTYRARERRLVERERAAQPGVAPEEAEPM